MLVLGSAVGTTLTLCVVYLKSEELGGQSNSSGDTRASLVYDSVIETKWSYAFGTRL